jgi:hypothetical protein
MEMQYKICTTTDMILNLKENQYAAMVKSEYYDEPVELNDNGDIVHMYKRSPLRLTKEVLDTIWIILDKK